MRQTRSVQIRHPSGAPKVRQSCDSATSLPCRCPAAFYFCANRRSERSRHLSRGRVDGERHTGCTSDRGRYPYAPPQGQRLSHQGSWGRLELKKARSAGARRQQRRVMTRLHRRRMAKFGVGGISRTFSAQNCKSRHRKKRAIADDLREKKTGPDSPSCLQRRQ